MQVYNLQNDIKVFCTTATSFPDGIQQAFITLDNMLSREGRTFYGISYETGTGNIIYKAAVSESFAGESEELGFEAFTISKGEYLTETIFNWRKRIEDIAVTFSELGKNNLAQKTYPYVEWYKTDDEMLCMIRVDQRKKLQGEFGETITEFIQLISSLNKEQVNASPFEGSWTAGQLAQHIILTVSGLAEMLNGPVEETEREPDEKVETIKNIFLDFTTKFKTPEFGKPADVLYEKEELLGSLEGLKKSIDTAIQSLSLTKTCSSFEIPQIGFLTRLEAVYFATYHTQRHVHQLKNIVDCVMNKASQTV